MKKFFPLCLLLIVASVWTISGAGISDRVPTSNSIQQAKVYESQNPVAVQSDELTPEKAARIRAEKEARHEEILRSLAKEQEEISSERAVEYPPDATTNYGGGIAPELESVLNPDRAVTIKEAGKKASEPFRGEIKEVRPPFLLDCVDSITIEILTDDFGDETSWEVRYANGGAIVATGGGYLSNTLYIEVICASPDSCYEFTIFDAYGDGICCGWGNGYYNVFWNGTLVATGGQFGFFETVYAIGNNCTIPYGQCCYGDVYNPTCVDTVATACAAIGGVFDVTKSCLTDYCAPCDTVAGVPPNDSCQNVTPVALVLDVPQVFIGNSCNSTVDCGLLAYPHVWEAFTTSEVGDLWIEYCGSNYDGGPWEDGYIVLEANCPCVSNTYADTWFFDCPDGNVRILWQNLPPGTYYYPVIWEPGYNAGGDYVLTVTLNSIIPCIVDCPVNAIIEGEPPCSTDYVDNFNGGCNSTPNVFQYIDCGDTVCGETGTYLYQGEQYRDTDWFEFTTTTTMDITLTGVAELPFLMFLIDAGSGDCSDYTIIGDNSADPCSLLTLTVEGVPPGTYYAWASTYDFYGGWPCGSTYWFTVDCVESIGRCCYNNDLDCADITESACNALAGNWTYGFNCIDNPCTCPEDQVVIEVFTDEWPGETTWDLVDQYSTVIASGGPYGNSNTLYIHEICVEDTSCLFFTIYDSYGDGICCDYGNGYYNVYFNDSLMATGGAFGFSESVGPFGTGCGVVIGRCCYGDPYNPSCDDIERSACDALDGSWSFSLNCTDNPCPAVPTNDSCNNAITVAVPSSTPGSTTFATPDTLECGTNQEANSVWYKVIGTGNTITVTTCDAGSNYDTKLQVWCYTCDDLMCVDGNDDMGSANCSYNGLLSRVAWCSEQGTEYLIHVGGFAQYAGDFVLNVSDNGTPCSTPPLCTPPVGRCCYNSDQDCADVTEDACAALGGVWTVLLNCNDNPCPCQTGQDKIFLDLTTDSWPDEVTWEVYDRTVGLVAAGGPYPDPNTNYVEEICVDQGGCYDWHIYDAFGDGGGPYNLYYAGTLVHSSDGSYGEGESVYDIGSIGCGEAYGACCFNDASCADLTETDCIAQGGVTWQIYAACVDVECPLVLECDTTVLWHNGFPIGYARGSQCDPAYPMQAEMADDFMLSGTDPVTVGNVLAWFDHWNGNVNGPADYLGINVTVYADDPNSLPYHAPGGKPIDGDTLCAHIDIIPGGVVYTVEVPAGDFAYFEDGFYWRLQIPIDVTLDPNITYWLSVEPIMIFADAGQSGWVDGNLFQGYTAVQIFEQLGTLVWTQQSPAVDLAFCLLPPSGPSGCDYAVGDVNGSNNYNGLDITYGVAFFKGGPAPQCPDCLPCTGWNYCGDVNNSCNYNGLDITYGVAYFKGGPGPMPCGDCPPIGGLTGGNQGPEMPQVIKSKTVNQKGTGLK